MECVLGQQNMAVVLPAGFNYSLCLNIIMCGIEKSLKLCEHVLKMYRFKSYNTMFKIQNELIP